MKSKYNKGFTPLESPVPLQRSFLAGFTLIEVLITTIVMILVIIGAVGLYLMSVTCWKEGGTEVALQRKASIAMEKMARGVDGTNGLREADNVALSGSTSILYTSGIDGKERRFYLQNGKVMYDPNNAVADDEFSIADCVKTSPSGLTFAINGNIVTINLSLQDRVVGKYIGISLSTEVKLRN